MFIFLDIIKVLSDTDGVVKIVHLGTVLGVGELGNCVFGIAFQCRCSFYSSDSAMSVKMLGIPIEI